MRGWQLNFFFLLFPVCVFPRRKNILSETSKDKKAARAALKGGSVSLYSAQESLNSAVRLYIFQIVFKKNVPLVLFSSE